MYGSKHKSNVALFPLCDTRGVLIDALCSTSEKAATRGDALVFAWRLELPASMNIAHAANSVLRVAMSVPRDEWSREQLVIIRELMVLAGREGVVPKPDSDQAARTHRSQKRTPKKSPIRSRPTAVPDVAAEVSRYTQDLPTNQRSFQPKETKQWWKLVGKQDPVTGKSLGQRKTRRERVSREPWPES